MKKTGKEINREWALKFCLTLLLFFWGIYGGYLIYQNIFEPAYVSYLSSCHQSQAEEEFPEYTMIGVTQKNISTGEVQVSIRNNLSSELNSKVVKHELVHVSQISNNVIFSCSHPVIFYFNEVEAYVSQNLPDSIFYRIYNQNNNSKDCSVIQN